MKNRRTTRGIYDLRQDIKKKDLPGTGSKIQRGEEKKKTPQYSLSQIQFEKRKGEGAPGFDRWKASFIMASRITETRKGKGWENGRNGKVLHGMGKGGGTNQKNRTEGETSSGFTDGRGLRRKSKKTGCISRLHDSGSEGNGNRKSVERDQKPTCWESKPT